MFSDLMGFGVTSKGKPVIVIDYNPVLSILNNKCSLAIPNSYRPEVLGNENLKLSSCEIYPKYFSCMSDAKELDLLWDEFQGDGYPLDKISESLLVYDINDFLRGILLIPSLIEPVILIDSINSCKSIKGTDLRKSNLKRVLNGIVKEQANLDQLGHRCLHNEMRT